MPTSITDISILSLRFPSSWTLDGSDTMNPDPDYSATYVTLDADHPDGLQRHGLTLTIGRGNEVYVAAVEILKPLVVGLEFEAIRADMAGAG